MKNYPACKELKTRGKWFFLENGHTSWDIEPIKAKQSCIIGNLY